MVGVMNPPMSQPKIEILPLKKGFLRAASEATHVLVRIVAPSQPTDVVATPRAPLDLALVIAPSRPPSKAPSASSAASAAMTAYPSSLSTNGSKSSSRCPW
jgi:hypothetical protein